MSKRFIILSVLLLAFVAGCADMKKLDKSAREVEQQGEKWKDQSRSRTVEVTDEPYLGAKSMPLNALGSPVLNRQVTFKRKGSLSTVATAIGDLVGIPVQVYQDEDPRKAPGASQEPRQPQSQPSAQQHAPADIDAGLEALLERGVGSASSVAPYLPGQLSVSYEGTLKGLLDHVAVLSGYGWDYDAVKNQVVFAKTLVKTFVLQGAPGKVSYDNRLTNKSKELSSSMVGMGSNVGQTVQSADTQTQTAQSNTTTLSFDIWVDTEKAVRALLSPKGHVVINQAAGTLTVRDTPQVLRLVANYIDDVNSRISRQVALTIQVWQLSVNDSLEGSLNLQAIFQNDDIRVVAGSLVAGGDLGTAAATIVSGKLKDSNAVLKTLRQWGKASQVTSAGGLAMSNQPIPAMAIERHAYLAGVGTSQTTVANTTMVQPGEVTTGFSMTVIPHILDQRKVILQYNVNISSLDSMQEFETADVTVQLPQVSTQAFSQRATLKMGQTLVLSGFEKEKHGAKNQFGIINAGRQSDYGKTLLVITISVESGEV
jgi:type IVB pilus formation R64 PilN family outer membrane protein